MTNFNLASNRFQDNNKLRNLQAEFEFLSKELAAKELELATLENELSVFKKRYTKAIGILFAELDEIEKEIAKELFRLHPEDDYKRNFQSAERKAKNSQEAVKEEIGETDKKRFVPSEDLKNLFHKVAKTIHPDFATNEDERAFRTTLMAKANAAYRNGNNEALEQILVEWEHWSKNSNIKEEQLNKLDQLEKKILQIKLHLTEIETKITELKKSELYTLMLKVEQAEQHGKDLLLDMADDIQRKIQAAKELLGNLKQKDRGGI